MLFVILVTALLSAFYFFVVGIQLWVVALMVLPGVLLTVVVVGGQKNENS